MARRLPPLSQVVGGRCSTYCALGVGWLRAAQAECITIIDLVCKKMRSWSAAGGRAITEARSGAQQTKSFEVAHCRCRPVQRQGRTLASAHGREPSPRPERADRFRHRFVDHARALAEYRQAGALLQFRRAKHDAGAAGRHLSRGRRQTGREPARPHRHAAGREGLQRLPPDLEGVPKDYVANTITDAATLRDAGYKMEKTSTLRNMPVVPDKSRARARLKGGAPSCSGPGIRVKSPNISASTRRDCRRLQTTSGCRPST